MRAQRSLGRAILAAAGLALASLGAASARAAAPAPAPALGPAPAKATKGRVALFPFEGFDLTAMREMDPVTLTTLVKDRLERAGWGVVEPPLTLRDMIVAVGCAAVDGPCAQKIGAHLDVDRVVVGKINGAEASMLVRARVFRTSDGGLELDREVRAFMNEEGRARAYEEVAAAVAGDGVVSSAGEAGARVGGRRLAGTASIGLLAAGGALLVAAAGLGVGFAVTFGHLPSRADGVDTIAEFETAERARRISSAGLALAGTGAAVALAGVLLAVLPRKGKSGAPRVALTVTPLAKVGAHVGVVWHGRAMP